MQYIFSNIKQKKKGGGAQVNKQIYHHLLTLRHNLDFGLCVLSGGAFKLMDDASE